MNEHPVRFHSLAFQSDPSMTKGLRSTYERKLAKLFVSFRHLSTKMMLERTFETMEPSISRISFPNLTDAIMLLMNERITVPAGPIISQMVNEALKAGKYRAGVFLRSVGVHATLGDTTVDQRVFEVINERNIAALKGITDEMGKRIKAQLSEGIVKGEGMKKLAGRLSEATAVPLNRARVMARTETMFAFNTAKDEEFKRYGVAKVEWVAARDERMCPTCGSYHGKVFPIDECPPCPNHPNCRCTTIPYIEED